MKLRRTLRKKNNKRGFTLVELLAVIMIMSITMAMIGAGIPVVKTAYSKVTLRAEAQVLMSTAIYEMEQDLRAAGEVKAISTSDAVGGLAITTGVRGATYYYKNVSTDENVDAYIQLTPTDPPDPSNPDDPSKKPQRLVTNKATSDGRLLIKMTDIDFQNGCFTYTLEISAANSEFDEKLSQTVAVRPTLSLTKKTA